MTWTSTGPRALKQDRLRRLATKDGVIAAVAIDQRKSLRKMMAAAAGVEWQAITTEQVSAFKAAVTEVLSSEASAVLLDPEYGSAAFDRRAAGCGLLMTYEDDGYENPRPHRMLALMPRYSVSRLRDAGADGIKILLSWAPDDDELANDEKRILIERVGLECEAAGLPFFLEPVVYDPAGADPRSIEFARHKPEMVIRTMEEFSRPVYRVDVLKVEFPVIAAYVEGSPAYRGAKVWSVADALGRFREADGAARCPYIYLSAGVSGVEFLASLRMAAEAGAAFSGVLCGRANWQEGVPLFMQGGTPALLEWLHTSGLENVRNVNQCLQAAVAWDTRYAVGGERA